MRIEHGGRRPHVSDDASVAPTAVLSGDVRVAAGACILHGAILTADGGPVVVGPTSIVMENAVLRGSRRHPLTVGAHVLVGPHAYLSGCTVEDEVFLATGTTVFNGARLGARAEIRVNGVVHVNSALAPDAVVPIGWIAAGDPAELFPPEAHERLWSVQKAMDFPGTVFGMARPPAGRSGMPELTRRYAAALRRHSADRIIGETEG